MSHRSPTQQARRRKRKATGTQRQPTRKVLATRKQGGAPIIERPANMVGLWLPGDPIAPVRARRRKGPWNKL